MVDADRLEAKAVTALSFEAVRDVMNTARAAVLNGREPGCADGDGVFLLARAMIVPLSASRWSLPMP
ncbi:hypothetical protein [Streptomyces sp. NBC_01445]|uniref:hypothetical protein n=1 Tax=Streptomyces sp. NBC_01445 TaxID=2903869 RepID=UPI002DD9E9B3|nr:hypothetical protein [Streptomyces sp. NBC_01445]WSE03446.1 hypothetical protein OG574_08605 [Streptomyces sp. NBC_01445]